MLKVWCGQRYCTKFIGTACVVCGARSMKRYNVRPFVCPSSSSKPAAAGLLLWARRAGDVDGLLETCGGRMRAVPRCQRTSVAQHRFVVTNFAVCFIVFFSWLSCCILYLAERRHATLMVVASLESGKNLPIDRPPKQYLDCILTRLFKLPMWSVKNRGREMQR